MWEVKSEIRNGGQQYYLEDTQTGTVIRGSFGCESITQHYADELNRRDYGKTRCTSKGHKAD